MKNLFISAFFITALFISPAAYTQNVIIGDEYSQSVISGIVTDIGFEELTLKIDDNKYITVETDDMDIEDGYMDEIIDVGSNIKVIGQFDDEIFEAEQIISLQDSVDINTNIN